MNTINFTIPLDNIEIWTLNNLSPIAHPFHIHDVHFYILDRNGNPPPASEQGRKDVVVVPAMGTVRFIAQFTDYANDEVPYMYHCHMLVHEDDGMMGQFEVVENTVGISQEELIENDISIYPNPTNGKEVKVVIKSGISIIEYYELTSVTGNRIIHEPVGANLQEINLNLSTVLPGTYVLKIKTPDKFYTEILIKN
jgi:bilirubin oxidase